MSFPLLGVFGSTSLNSDLILSWLLSELPPLTHRRLVTTLTSSLISEWFLVDDATLVLMVFIVLVTTLPVRTDSRLSASAAAAATRPLAATLSVAESWQHARLPHSTQYSPCKG
jgi:hypothetical protein